MPVSADALTEQGFRVWVDSIHPVFAESRLADRLVEDGYDRVSVANHVTEEMIRGDCGVKPGHAKVFADAALAVHKALGYGTSTTTTLVASSTGVRVPPQKVYATAKHHEAQDPSAKGATRRQL